jgi:carbon-monoxide dehydrogenase large subunit
MEAFTEKFGIGQPVRRKEDQRLLTGGGRYTDDINFDGQAHLAFYRSPHAHAIVKNIDTTAAATAPGVIAVYAGRDMDSDGVGRVETDIPLTALDGTLIFKTQRLGLPVDKVRYVGEPVAVVIAETAAQAQDGAELIDIDFEELPAIATAEQAIA